MKTLITLALVTLSSAAFSQVNIVDPTIQKIASYCEREKNITDNTRIFCETIDSNSSSCVKEIVAQELTRCINNVLHDEEARTIALGN